MAAVDGMPTFGAELKDGFKPANAWVSHGVAWLDDIQQFYRERSIIEKEYSAKLNALAKKYFEKKNKKSSQLSVGDTPTMTPGSLESASLTTWAMQLTNLEARAANVDRYGNHLISQVAEPLKYYGAKFEELRKRHAEYAAKLENERELSNTELRKIKGKYDTVCQEVETKRKKSESSYDKAKAQSVYQQQLFEMNNAKNSYLIAINVNNKLKERYYHECIPEVMDSLQDLSEFKTTKLNQLWSVATELEGGLMSQGHELMQSQGNEISRNAPHLDSMMYIRHNIGAFSEPPDKTFEPSPVWHDDDLMVVDDMAKVYLRNVLSKSKASLGELRREVDKKRREVESVKTLKQRVRQGKEKQDDVEVVRMLFALQEVLHSLERDRLTAEVETSTITSVVGDVTLGAKNHNFKGQTFKIPTNCDLCGERIWGLSAKGFDCRDCGYTCHSKCEMKVPADCPGEQSKEDRKKLKAQRQEAAGKLLKPSVPTSGSTMNVSELPDLSRSNTMTSSLSSREAQRSATATSPAAAEEDGRKPTAASTTKRRIMAPPPVAYISKGADGIANGGHKEEKKGRMLYGFDASRNGELSVQEGKDVVLLEEDDGSGWVKVRSGVKEGLVPSSYVDFSSPSPSSSSPPLPPAPPPITAPRPTSSYSTSTTSSSATAAATKKKGPAVAPKRGAKKLRYVEALYDYAATGAGEHSMAEGERFVLVKEDPGDGWVDVEKAGVTGSVPAAYVQIVP